MPGPLGSVDSPPPPYLPSAKPGDSTSKAPHCSQAPWPPPGPVPAPLASGRYLHQPLQVTGILPGLLQPCAPQQPKGSLKSQSPSMALPCLALHHPQNNIHVLTLLVSRPGLTPWPLMGLWLHAKQFRAGTLSTQDPLGGAFPGRLPSRNPHLTSPCLWI